MAKKEDALRVANEINTRLVSVNLPEERELLTKLSNELKLNSVAEIKNYASFSKKYPKSKLAMFINIVIGLELYKKDDKVKGVVPNTSAPKTEVKSAPKTEVKQAPKAEVKSTEKTTKSENKPAAKAEVKSDKKK